MENHIKLAQDDKYFPNIIDRHYFGTISAVCLLDNYLLLGNGNILKILDYNNSKYIHSTQIFNQSKITKIKIFSFSNYKIILLIAETELKYCLHLNENNLKNLNFKTIKNLTNDYIIDAFIFEKFLILGYVNNFVDILIIDLEKETEILSLKTNFIKRLFCPEKCIVYSMNIVHFSNYDLIIASGTVFRNIIIWKINLSDLKSTSTLLNLKGHQGVVFNLYFADIKNLLSVSDDRTAKHWILNYENLTYDETTCHGHSARIWDGKIDLKNKLVVTVSEDCTGRVYDLVTKKLLRELGGAHLGKNIRCVEMNEKSIFTAGEDWQIVKWDITDLRSDYDKSGETKNIKNFNKNENVMSMLLPDDENCRKAREKQKNFSPAVKFLKLVKINDIDNVMIGTNHGEVLIYNVTADFNDNNYHTVYSDSKLRVINSLDLIQSQNSNLLLVGLSDGGLGIVNINNLTEMELKNFPDSSEKQIFHNIRVSFIFHKHIDNNNIILMFSTPLGTNKIYLIPVNDINSIYEILEDKYNNNAATILTGSKHPLQICSGEVIQANPQSQEYTIFLGDIGGNLYFTELKKIGDRFFAYSDVKYLKIHGDDKISYIKFFDEENLLYTCGRDGKIKKFLLNYKKSSNKKNNFRLAINEVDCKTRNDFSSCEYLYKDGDNFFLAGHHGREILILDFNKNAIFYSKDIKGSNRAFDIIFKNNGNLIYAYAENREITITNLKYSPMNTEMKVVNYNTPLHGKLIHTTLLVNLNEDLCLLVTASEDTKINFYTFDKNNFAGLKFVDQFTRHTGAVRKIHIIEKNESHVINNFVTQKHMSLILCSVGGKSETFVFKLEFYLSKESVFKNSLFFLCDLAQKQENLDTRNMSCDSIKISCSKRKYLLTICNTLNNFITFLFDFDKNEFQPLCYKSLSMRNTNFIPLCVKLFDVVEKSEKRGKKINLIFGLTNGIIYITQINLEFEGKLNSLSEDKQYKIHEAGINDMKLHGKYLFTCGEDNSVIISFMKSNGDLEILKKIYSLHSSPVKSINLLEYENRIILLTAGYDQNMNILNIKTNNLNDQDELSLNKILIEKKNRIDLEYNLLYKINACTAEINSSQMIRDLNGNIIISIVGQGVELFKIKYP